MRVFVAQVTTVTLSRLSYVYLNEPTREDVIKRLMREEGAPESCFEWYSEHTSVYINKTIVIGTEEEMSKVEVHTVQCSTTEVDHTKIKVCSDTTSYLLSSEANRERLMESIEQMNRLKQNIQKQNTEERTDYDYDYDR